MRQLESLMTNVTKTVLLIDDEEQLLEALSKYLESKKIRVLMAQSTEEALRILQSNIPDLLIIDVMMPYQTGYDFIIDIKKDKRFTAIPFIFLSAKGMTKDRIKGYRLGCRSYITKPFDPEEVLTVINNIIIETKDIYNIKRISREIKKIRLTLENKNNTYIKFTPREKIILFEITEGETNERISKKMKTGIRNVEKYISRLFNKTNTKNRTDLVRFAYKFYQSLKANDENRTRE
jgi:DNA-binding NarL/FixJ family response regulator